MMRDCQRNIILTLMTEARFSVLSEFTCHKSFSGTDVKNEGPRLKQFEGILELSSRSG